MRGMARSCVSVLFRPLLAALALMLLAGCGPRFQRNPLADELAPSPNFNARRVSLVVIHHTSSSHHESALRTLRDPLREVSAHYLITRDGRVIQLVDESERAWHAGRARWGAISDVNSASIGIELDNNGDEVFPDAQMAALYRLLGDLRVRHRLTPLAYVGHADVAPGRKVDPSAYFPWRAMAQRGFGLWCDAPLASAPAGFDVALGLQALGYDLAVPDAAATAFALHYGAPQTGLAALDPALVACIVAQARAVIEP